MRYWIFLVISISFSLLWLTIDTIEQQQPVMRNNTQTVPQASHNTVATFKADAPYLPPEQRTPDNLGGPPSRDMMLTSPQDIY